MTVLVVGAGLAGLSAACHLAGRGYDVTVVEREAGPGGRAGRLHADGFSFDTGPTVLTMPDLLARVVGAVGVELAEVLPLTRLDPAYRGVFADGSEIFVRAGQEAMAEEIRSTCGPADAAAFTEFVRWLQRLYELELPHFIEANFDHVGDLLRHPAALIGLVRLGAFGRLGPLVRRRFADERLHRLFSFQAMYAGLSPEDALAIYAVITYMDCVQGVWTAPGGMYAVPLALAAVAERAGVQFHYSTSVRRLLRRADGFAAGVETEDGRRLSADAVVLTPDLPVAYDELLSGVRPPKAVRHGRYSPSCVVWHVGTRDPAPEPIAHHNIHFGRDWAGAFTALIDDQVMMPDPSRFVCVPSRSDPAMAVPSGACLYVLEPVPNLAGRGGQIDWDEAKGPMRERFSGFLHDNGYPGDVVTDTLVTPLDWQRQGLKHGTPFALAHNFGQTGPFRPPNAERHVPGLFFAGSGTVPGVGVPMVLISGELVAQRVARYLR